jgi:hypothetical protein
MKTRPRDARNWKHGYADTPTYQCWQHLRDRCSNPNNKNYPQYGGRGIKVCAKWDRSFVAFLKDMGERPSLEHSIDRIDNDGDYRPANCRWATKLTQNNNSGNCRRLTHDGITDTVTGWAKRLGCPAPVLLNRLFRGRTTEETLAPPFDRNVAKRNTPRYEFKGESLTIPQWATRTGIPRNVLGYRIKAGWSLADALTTPTSPQVRRIQRR